MSLALFATQLQLIFSTISFLHLPRCQQRALFIRGHGFTELSLVLFLG